MSSEKKIQRDSIWEPVRTGAVGLLLMLVLLMGFAFLISRGYLPENNKRYVIPVSSLLAGFFARKMTDSSREEGALRKAMLSAFCMGLMTMVLSAGLKGTYFHWKGIMTTAGSYIAGDLLGSIIRVNKKYRQKHHQKQKYNR